MINVILADHERIFRVGMASALAAEDDIRIVGQPSSPGQLIRYLGSFRPRVLVLSTAFLTHFDSIKQICNLHNIAILLLQDYGGSTCEGNSNDFHGVMLRSTDKGTVVEYIRHLARGGRVLRLSTPGLPAAQEDFVGARVRERLSSHELTIISFVVQGFKNREIAFRTGTSEHSVKHALRKIYDKTGMCGRLELALFVMHHRTLLDMPIDLMSRLPNGKPLPIFVDSRKPPTVN